MKPAGPKVAERLRDPRGVKCMIYIDLYGFMDIYGQLLLDFDDFDGVNLAAQWNAEIRPEYSARNRGISMI